VCVMGGDPERNKIPRSHLWTGPPDARRFASARLRLCGPEKGERKHRRQSPPSPDWRGADEVAIGTSSAALAREGASFTFACDEFACVGPGITS
jgi:hypothetical protein